MSTTAGERVRRTRSRRTWVVLALALVAGVGVSVWSQSGKERWPDPLDPRNPGREGAQALARVLEREGVEIAIARSADALERTDVDDASIVVTGSESLAPSTLRRLLAHADGAPVVIVDAPYPVAADIDTTLETDLAADVRRTARCTAPVDLGTLRLATDDAVVYRGAPALTTCFDGPRGAVLAARDDGVVLFGGGQALTNDQVLRADNAAVALRLLGQRDRLVWYLPDAADATADEAVTLSSLLPAPVLPALWLGAIATLGLLLWRVRRLGPLVGEPLPVVVRAVETALSRGRLYRRTDDRGHAAAALRAAARTDLAARLRLESAAPVAAVIAATAGRLDRPYADVAALLDPHQPPPASDHDLVALARALARLRREVRRG